MPRLYAFALVQAIVRGRTIRMVTGMLGGHGRAGGLVIAIPLHDMYVIGSSVFSGAVWEVLNWQCSLIYQHAVLHEVLSD